MHDVSLSFLFKIIARNLSGCTTILLFLNKLPAEFDSSSRVNKKSFTLYLLHLLIIIGEIINVSFG